VFRRRGRGVQALAVDLSLAALLGEDIYSFGELLSHPVVRTACVTTQQNSTPPNRCGGRSLARVD
jgi:hypothetical protein